MHAHPVQVVPRKVSKIPVEVVSIAMSVRYGCLISRHGFDMR